MSMQRHSSAVGRAGRACCLLPGSTDGVWTHRGFGILQSPAFCGPANSSTLKYGQRLWSLSESSENLHHLVWLSGSLDEALLT